MKNFLLNTCKNRAYQRLESESVAGVIIDCRDLLSAFIFNRLLPGLNYGDSKKQCECQAGDSDEYANGNRNISG